MKGTMWRGAVVLLVVAGLLELLVGLRLAGMAASPAPPGGAGRTMASTTAATATPAAPPRAPMGAPRGAATLTPVPDLPGRAITAAAIVAGEPFTVTLTEAQLNERLAQVATEGAAVDTPIGAMQLRHSRVGLGPGEAVIESRTVLGGAEVPLAVRAGVSVSPDGRAVLAVRAVEAGGVPIGGPMRQLVERAAQAQLDQALGRLPFRLSRIEIESGRLVIAGTR